MPPNPDRQTLPFFALVLLLSIPFWLLGWLAGSGFADLIPVNLPISALMAFNPAIAAAILYHTISNLSWTLFPNYGSHYDPFVIGLLTGLAALAVTLAWGPRTLSRARMASQVN